MTAVGRGRGKVILLGEHAVVYGAHALVASLNAGVEVTAAVRAEPGWALDDASGAPLAEAGDGSPLDRALAALASQVVGLPPGVRLRVETGLPTGVGLGSSAAFSVAAAGALAALAGTELDDSALLAAANAAEAVFHTNPSGVDVAAAMGTGLLLFRRGAPPRPLAPPASIPIIVARVSEAPPTRVMVEGVAALREREPASVDAAVTAIDALALRGAEAATAGDWEALGRLLDENQRWLERLGVSTRELERACTAARWAGAAGAKLTGGGGGGCVVALAPGSEEAVARALGEAGAEVVGR